MGVVFAPFMRGIRCGVAAIIFAVTTFPSLADIHSRGISANEATYFNNLVDENIPSEIRSYIKKVLHKPENFSEKVLASALRKVGNSDYEEKNGNSNTAPGINRVLMYVGAKPGSSWCAASITDDLRKSLGGEPPIGSANVTQLFNQAYIKLAVFREYRGIEPGDIVSHADTSHALLFLAFDPKNPKFFWGIDGNGQDWINQTPREGERIVYRPVSKIKEYIDLKVLFGERSPIKEKIRGVKAPLFRF